MNNNIFRYFIRKNFPEAGMQLSNEELDEVSVDFDNYLKNKLSNDQYEAIAPKDAVEVLMKDSHPLKINGFHPAYVYHFIEFSKTFNGEN